MEKRVCIIPCGAKKIWDIVPEAGPTMAKDAYRSAFHQACQSYAKAFFADWLILSAKHGFLAPDDWVVANYDCAFGTDNPAIIGVEALRESAAAKRLDQYGTIVLLGGKKFVPVLAPLVGEGQRIERPLAHCRGIGTMVQTLKRAVEEDRELDLRGM
ncbi:DUF6884 domain-containing protein [Brevibacillus fluminis]|uniref:DUF6884 domain-containing protein n=1 Tax=Brevibacillus fluminis TaxID=511487 RepID=UPI003F8B887B